MTSTKFIAGLDLSQSFFGEAIAPLLASDFPQLSYSCGLIGSGSEVLGFDDEMSADHHWGPRALLFLSDAEHERVGPQIADLLSRGLPREFRGYPTNFTAPDPSDNGTQLLQAIESGPVNHRVEIWTIRKFFLNYTGFDVTETMMPCHWLAIPQQKLRTITCGRIFRDDLNLNETCGRFSYYPRDLWLYLLACGWSRIEEEEHLMGRSGYVGDELGSAVIGARLVRDVMTLCFLMERQYIPYAKWFGMAFQLLPLAAQLTPLLQATLAASDWHQRERHLCAAYESLAARFNSLGVTKILPTAVEPFFGRQFLVISRGRFSAAIVEKIEDPEVKAIACRGLNGSIDLFSDNTDILAHSGWFARVVEFVR